MRWHDAVVIWTPGILRVDFSHSVDELICDGRKPVNHPACYGEVHVHSACTSPILCFLKCCKNKIRGPTRMSCNTASAVSVIGRLNSDTNDDATASLETCSFLRWAIYSRFYQWRIAEVDRTHLQIETVSLRQCKSGELNMHRAELVYSALERGDAAAELYGFSNKRSPNKYL